MPRYIDADELKKFDFDKIFDYKASYEICLGIEAVLMIAEKMPSADVQEVKHACWRFVNGYITCTNCGSQPYKDTRHIDFENLHKYCPGCSAKMDLEGGDDE